jgi:hypothetical protein
MFVKEETLEYLNKSNLLETLNIINTRDLHNELANNLKNNNIMQKAKIKV